MDHVFSIARVRDFNTFSQNNNVDVEPPLLVSPNNTPLGSGIGKSLATPQGGVVDVVSDFYWTYSKLRESRQEVPKIILTERKLKTNALISQLKYSLGASADNIKGIVNNLPDGIKNPLYNFINQVKQSDAGKSLGNSSDAVKSKINQIDFLQDNNSIYDKNPYLLPYQNLYITEPTGWQFLIPYFENYNNSQSNTFASDANNPVLGLLQKGADLVGGVAEITSVLRNPTQISFTEKTKFYNYPTEGEELSFSFPLINTGSASFNDVIKNWELLFLLLYNNKPSRKNVAIIDPPVIYQVEIPGVKFLPFCYIAGININFKGSRRELSFELSTIDSLSVDKTTESRKGGPGQLRLDTIKKTVRGFSNISTVRNITTIIPDAYEIQISLKSLLPDTKNFMYSVLNKEPVVSASTLSPNVNSILNPFSKTQQNNQESINLRSVDTNILSPDINTSNS